MKHIHTFESFLNEAKKSSKVITLRKFLSKDHNALWKWMQKEFGPTKYSPALLRIAGPLTHGGDFTLDVSDWDEKDIETLKDYLSSQNHVFENFLNEGLFESHNYTVQHQVGDEIDLPSLGNCKVEEINFKPKKVYKNPFQSVSKDFKTFEIVKAYPKTTHAPQSIGNNAIRLVNKFGDSVLMYQYESGGKVYTQYALMD